MLRNKRRTHVTNINTRTNAPPPLAFNSMSQHSAALCRSEGVSTTWHTPKASLRPKPYPQPRSLEYNALVLAAPHLALYLSTSCHSWIHPAEPACASELLARATLCQDSASASEPIHAYLAPQHSRQHPLLDQPTAPGCATRPGEVQHRGATQMRHTTR